MESWPTRQVLTSFVRNYYRETFFEEFFLIQPMDLITTPLFVGFWQIPYSFEVRAPSFWGLTGKSRSTREIRTPLFCFIRGGTRVLNKLFFIGVSPVSPVRDILVQFFFHEDGSAHEVFLWRSRSLSPSTERPLFTH